MARFGSQRAAASLKFTRDRRDGTLKAPQFQRIAKALYEHCEGLEEGRFDVETKLCNLIRPLAKAIGVESWQFKTVKRRNVHANARIRKTSEEWRRASNATHSQTATRQKMMDEGRDIGSIYAEISLNDANFREDKTSDVEWVKSETDLRPWIIQEPEDDAARKRTWELHMQSNRGTQFQLFTTKLPAGVKWGDAFANFLGFAHRKIMAIDAWKFAEVLHFSRNGCLCGGKCRSHEIGGMDHPNTCRLSNNTLSTLHLHPDNCLNRKRLFNASIENRLLEQVDKCDNKMVNLEQLMRKEGENVDLCWMECVDELKNFANTGKLKKDLFGWTTVKKLCKVDDSCLATGKKN